MKKALTLAIILAATAAAYTPAQARTDVAITFTESRVAPPAPRYERVPRARAGYAWAPGYWVWRGHRHEWVPGIWVAERPGYTYVQANWYDRGGRWVMEPAHWEQHGHHGRGHDKDHDGIPNRYDRDRDGDGVPNRYDRRPDNPRKN